MRIGAKLLSVVSLSGDPSAGMTTVSSATMSEGGVTVSTVTPSVDLSPGPVAGCDPQPV